MSATRHVVDFLSRGKFKNNNKNNSKRGDDAALSCELAPMNSAKEVNEVDLPEALETPRTTLITKYKVSYKVNGKPFCQDQNMIHIFWSYYNKEITLNFTYIKKPRSLLKQKRIKLRPYSKVEKELQELLESGKDPSLKYWNTEDLERLVTAKNLCSCRDPINMTFKVNRALRGLADSYTENTQLLNQLADRTEDFAVQLLDDFSGTKELVPLEAPENAERFSQLLLSKMTNDAIIHSQKKFTAHPLLYEYLKMRWKLGLPEGLKGRGKFRTCLLFLLILIDTVLTPLLLPLIGYFFYSDPIKRLLMSRNPRRRTMTITGGRVHLDISGRYLSYFTTPFVVFVKDKLSQVVFIALHVFVCFSPSTVIPTVEEYLILVWSFGLIVSEYQQYKGARLKYFKDMWNYVDLVVLFNYIVIVLLRLATMIRGGDSHHNRLLEVANYFYGFNTMFLVLRFSSVLELNSVVGPLQLALFRMFVDLFVILTQFGFVILAFSLAITKSYITEMSLLTVHHTNETDVARNKTLYVTFSETSRNLIWSVFGLTELTDMKSRTAVTTEIVVILYLLFCILSVIMLVNMLIALLTNTYDTVKSNAEYEWKFARAIVETQYRLFHPIIVPFNLLTVPLCHCLHGFSRQQQSDEEWEQQYEDYCEHLFQLLGERYLKKCPGFPLSLEEKIDLIIEKLQIPHNDESKSEKQVENKMDSSPSVDIQFPGTNHMDSIDHDPVT